MTDKVLRAEFTPQTSQYCMNREIPVVRKNSVRRGLSLRNNAPKAHNPSFLEIIVGQESTVVVSFQPMIEVNLVEIRRDHLFSQFMSLRT